MEYEMMIPPFKHIGFASFKKKEASEYFKWYVSQVGHRIDVLKNYVGNETGGVIFDYTPDSLIALWTWYEKKYRLLIKPKKN